MRQRSDFEARTIARLRSLRADQAAIRRLREQLEASTSYLHALQFDQPRVQSSGTGSAVERLVIERDTLAARIQYLETSVRVLLDALDELPENEKLCVMHFYVSNLKGACSRLECEVPYSPAQLYRIRDAGVTNLAALLYGGS